MVVLASGDPGFFGIVRLLGARFGEGEPARLARPLLGRAGFRRGRALVGRCGDGQRPRPGPASGRQRVPCPSQGGGSHLPGLRAGRACAGSSTGSGAASWSRRSSGSRTSGIFRGEAPAIARMDWEDPNVVLVLDEERISTNKRLDLLGSPEPGAVGAARRRVRAQVGHDHQVSDPRFRALPPRSRTGRFDLGRRAPAAAR